MTCLHGGMMVAKTHDRIIFRGALDTLQAEFIEAQILADNAGKQWYCSALGEILVLLREIMKAEVTEAALKPFMLFGLSEDEIHSQSHNIKDIFGINSFRMPDYKSGPVAGRLNYLRTRVRETEILAIKAYNDEFQTDNTVIKAMNRISSALWWLYCRYTAGRED